MIPYSLRPMRLEDIAQVTEIEREAFPTMWSGINYKRELGNLQREYLVCVHNGMQAPVLSAPKRGFLDIIRRRSPSYSTEEAPELVVGFVGLWFSAGEGHILSIAVQEAYRGLGLGELLLLGAVELTHSREQQVVTLEVRVSNTVAQNLYAKYGFSQVGIRRAYYSDNREDAYIMTTSTLATAEYQEVLNNLRIQFAERYGEARRAYL